MRRLARVLEGEEGQMTVELLVALPVAIVIALIAFNAMTFLGMCAEFDRVARNAVRVHAAVPTQAAPTAAVGDIDAELAASFDEENVDVEVTGSFPSFDPAMVTCTLAYRPTLFGLGMRTEVLGVPLPALRHSIALSTFSYNPLY